jgi:hypothetical protein
VKEEIVSVVVRATQRRRRRCFDQSAFDPSFPLVAAFVKGEAAAPASAIADRPLRRETPLNVIRYSQEFTSNFLLMWTNVATYG